MSTPLLFFFFFFLISFPSYSLQTASVAPLFKDHISLLYSISLHLKTPLRPATLYLDLGGPFSWIDCYQNYNSSSYKLLLCNTPLSNSFNQGICGSCVQAPSPTCANDTIFTYAYPQNPSLRDQFVDYDRPELTDSENVITDVLALSTTDGSKSGPLRRISEIPFACVKTNFLRGLAKNVIGLAALGRSNLSIPSVISAKFNSPKFFAICLSGARSGPGVAFFGSKGPYRFSPNVDLSKSLTYTPLLFNPASGSIHTYWLPSYEYYVGLSAIRINGKVVPFNTSLLPFEPIHGNGGAKISTSTNYGLLESSIYRAFARVFMKEAAALNFKLINAVKPFGVCYAAKSVGVTAEGHAKAPVVDLVMEKGKVVWKLGGRNTMVRIKKKGVDAWCLGFINGGEFPRTPIVMGGLQMEDHLLQFDLEKFRFGFSSSALTEGTSCSKFNFNSINNNFL
ncbi:basic 7S globulin 2 [Cucumis melo var. makuwa]|uniref:Basic 7S globulin 2 n=1 Tax=Cucumis melo var. makuwa TaxID=1194695 RepID=A0A5D3D4L4_CUCMM|nr:basic 7S globulin 2 [Cucumis melo var. makuwa]TYK18488.1 basic 7S globulin 2 [Cucumis melo var. makuwa]